MSLADWTFQTVMRDITYIILVLVLAFLVYCAMRLRD